MLFVSRLIIILIAASIGMVRYKKLSMPFKLLSIYLLTLLIDEIANPLVIRLYKNNLVLLHSETIIQYLFLASIYYCLFRSNKLKRAIVILTFVVLAFFVFNLIVLQPINSMFPSNAMIANEIIFVILSLVMFKQMLLYPVQVNIMKQGVFWFNTAILFFSATMFLNFAMINYYYEHNVQTPVLAFSWNGSEILLNLLLGFAILIEMPQTNQQVDAKY